MMLNKYVEMGTKNVLNYLILEKITLVSYVNQNYINEHILYSKISN